MPEYFGLEITNEDIRDYLGYAILWGLLSFSLTLTTVEYFKNYSVKLKIIIVSKHPQN